MQPKLFGWFFPIVLALCVPGLGNADCLDYGDYIHSIGTFMPQGGQVPNAIDVALSGSVAYVVEKDSGHILEVLDVSNPASPVQLAALNMPTFTLGVTAVGSLVYVADAQAGLVIVNVSNPASPALIKTVDTPGVAEDVVVSGSYAYVADCSSGLQIIDVSNPATAAIVGFVDTPGNAFGVALSGSFAYVADEYVGLQVINVSNPLSPAIVGTVDTPGNAQKVRSVGTMVYVADAQSGLEVIDASNPLSPVILGTADTPAYAWDVTIAGTRAYVADDASGLQVIDVTNPTAPTILGSKQTPGTAFASAVSGTHVFVADWNYGLQVIDASNVTSVPIVGNVVIGPAYPPTNRVVISGSLAYIADGDSGLVVVNLTNPASPTIVSKTAFPGFARDVVISGTKAYVAYTRWIPPVGPSYANLAVVDVSTPASPQLEGDVEYNTNDFFPAVAVSGTTAYMGDGIHFFVIDVSNPLQPSIVGHLTSLSGLISGMEVSGSTVYVVDDGLKTIDVSNPTHPALKKSVAFPGYGHLVLSNGFAYVPFRGYDSGDPSGVQVVQVSASPPSLSLVGSIRLVGTTKSVALSGSYLYAGSEEGEVNVIDISNPASLALVGNADVYAMDVTVSGSWVYATSNPDGLSIIPSQCSATTAVEPENPGVRRPTLGQAFPNPAREASVTIPFSMSVAGPAKIRILDLAGREVQVLVDQIVEPGEGLAYWDGRNRLGRPVPAGIYFYELRTAGFQSARKLVRVR